MLGWLARALSMLAVYAEGRCPYIDFATELYNETYEALWHEYKVLKNGAKRTMAKPAVLGCGYQLSGGEETTDENGDAVKTGLLGYADAMGVKMTAEEAERAVSIFRTKYSEVKQYWRALEDSALAAVRNPGHRYPVGQVTFLCTGKSMLRILLPSGRALHYLFPEIVQKEITYTDKKSGKQKTIVKDTLTFAGKDQETRQWVRKSTYGGHLTENLCQAISRDILLEGMKRAEAMGFEVVGHVHDEIITLVDEDSTLSYHDLEQAMATVPEWAAAGEVRIMAGGEAWNGDENEPFETISWDALPLGAEGYEDDHYRKG
jgi:DNA polymerase